MKYFLIIIALFGLFTSFKPKPAYQIFTGEKSKSVDFDKMMKGLKEADVVFFGEIHNNSICHWLQLQVLKSLGESTGKKVIVGVEMFEADDQIVIDEYMSGLIKEKHLKKEAKIWDNYATDYAPIVDFAKKNKLPFIATNIPRRYANIVARGGFEGLDRIADEARKYMAPLPIEVDYELPGYKEISGMLAGHMGKNNDGGNKMIDAQAIKDATMAHFISINWEENHVFYHLNGSFHTRNREGIVYFLKKLQPDLNVRTISIVEQESIISLLEENKEVADFVIAIPSDMTRTF